MIRSPITHSDNVELIRQLHRDVIIDLYRRELNVEVPQFFRAAETVDVYECRDTGYRFYYPFSLAGPPALYRILQQIPWYYSDGKQEHDHGLAVIAPRKRVLEVGCGSGIFLRRLQQRLCDVVGLEINDAAINAATLAGVPVLRETVETHARHHCGEYDAVATFQVLEHVPDVKSFLESCILSLKTGGLLVISVPNNDAAYHKHHQDPLNMPPHHMGLWGVNSLIALQSYFPLTLRSLFTDTSTPRNWVQGQAMKAAEERLRSRCGPLAAVVARLGRRFIRLGAEAMIEFMPGQTITAVYRKTGAPVRRTSGSG